MRTVLPFLACLLLFPIIVSGQSPEHKIIQQLWHESNVREIRGEYVKAVDSLNALISEVGILSYPISEWYLGTSYFMKARCFARLGERDSTRASVELAFTHQFRNNQLIRFDTTILTVCGRSWFDSLEQVWMNIQKKEMLEWKAQPPIVMYPNRSEKKGKRNLIIVLQGGNGSYVRFADFWSTLADTLNAMIVVPAGTIRLSNVTNSWSSDEHQNETMVADLLSQIIKTDIIDTNNVYIVGYSQGAELALKLASSTDLPIKGVIAFSGFYNSPLSTTARDIARSSIPKIYALSGTMDDRSNLASIMRAKEEFTSLHFPFKLETVEGMLHEIPRDFPARVFQAWNWLHDPD